MTATCIVTNYVLIGVTNVKFMDLIVFITGFLFGPVTGGSVGFLTWIVYGTLNPFGFALPILVATSFSECIYGVVGGLVGRNSSGFMGDGFFASNLKFAIIGFILTFFYDLITNIVSAVTVGLPIQVGLISGIPFAIIHEVSNAVFFFMGASPAIKGIRRLFSEEDRNVLQE
jgi:hypothetical protein